MCFFSVDIISMFDCISMESVINELSKHVGCNIKGGFVNIAGLLELIRLDTNLFDVFRFFPPSLGRSKKPRYFHQRVGIPMGGNTSNVYADLYVSICLSKVNIKLERLGVKLIRKYVDDLLLYAPKANVSRIIEVLKDCTKLDFTCELPIDGSLSYLDVTLKDVEGKLSTSW